MRTTYHHGSNDWDALPTRETLRAPHKSRHRAARFTTRTYRGELTR